MNEAAVTIVTRMRDEASQKMKGMGQTMQNTQQQAFQFNLMLTTLGSAMSALGGLLGQIDSPLAKQAQKWFAIGAAVFLSISAISQVINIMKPLIATLRQLAVVQAIVQALSGPGGWLTLGVGLALAGGATAAIVGMTGGFSRGGGGTTNVNINTAAVMGNEQQARELARSIQRFNREDARIGR